MDFFYKGDEIYQASSSFKDFKEDYLCFPDVNVPTIRPILS